MLDVKQGSCEYDLLKSFGLTRRGNRIHAVQESMRSAEDAYPPPHCPTQLVLSPLASQLSPLHWYMAWNGVTPI